MDEKEMGLTSTWFALFDERQRKEIAFDRLYAAQFGHGTDGHNAKIIIAKLADLLDKHYLGETVTQPMQ